MASNSEMLDFHRSPNTKLCSFEENFSLLLWYARCSSQALSKWFWWEAPLWVPYRTLGSFLLLFWFWTCWWFMMLPLHSVPLRSRFSFMQRYPSVCCNTYVPSLNSPSLDLSHQLPLKDEGTVPLLSRHVAMLYLAALQFHWEWRDQMMLIYSLWIGIVCLN